MFPLDEITNDEINEWAELSNCKGSGFRMG